VDVWVVVEGVDEGGWVDECESGGVGEGDVWDALAVLVGVEECVAEEREVGCVWFEAPFAEEVFDEFVSFGEEGLFEVASGVRVEFLDEFADFVSEFHVAFLFSAWGEGV
jgi:hypothetical protein